MSVELTTVRAGLAIVLLGLFFNVALGISFALDEDAYKDYIAEGIAAHPELHDEKSKDKIWRYAQRTHFHAGGVAAFSLGLIILVMFKPYRDCFADFSHSRFYLFNIHVDYRGFDGDHPAADINAYCIRNYYALGCKHPAYRHPVALV